MLPKTTINPIHSRKQNAHQAHHHRNQMIQELAEQLHRRPKGWQLNVCSSVAD